MAGKEMKIMEGFTVFTWFVRRLNNRDMIYSKLLPFLYGSILVSYMSL
jgi:hypothetical protein